MKKALPALLLAALLVYVVPLGLRPMFIPDEARYAEIPREMIASGDWVVPHLDGLRYFEKPVLGYWLNAASMRCFGENNFAVRLPSALSAILSAAMVLLLVRRFGGGMLAALLSAAAFLSCFQVYIVGVFNVLDSLFSTLVTGTLAAFFFACMEREGRRRTLLLVLCGVFAGLAFLTKGFLACALPAVAVAPFLIWEGRFKESLRLGWLPATVAVLVALPWSIAIFLREPRFWHDFFWTEHVRRFFAQNEQAQHSEPFWFYIPVLLGGAFPWIALAPAAVRGLRRREWADPLMRFCLCWFASFFLLFSASSGKLGTYILPCFAPLMILVVRGLLRYLDAGGRAVLFQAGAIVTALLAGAGALFIVLMQTVPAIAFRLFAADDGRKWATLAAALLVMSVWAWLAGRPAGAAKRMVLFGCAPAALLFCLHFSLPEMPGGRDKGINPARLLARDAERVKPGTPVLARASMAHIACWVLRRDDVYLFQSRGEFDYGLDYPNAAGRFVKADDFEAFLMRHDKTALATLVSEAQGYREFKSKLPAPVFVDEGDGYVFAQYAPNGGSVPRSGVNQSLNRSKDEIGN